ncbi:MAG: carboxy-S-adenosyl-L-methionine synthase CmoA [Bacteroidia bacterium]|nr:carboxy-S-adenosyl-L-methionine synthase CmoA [Bacteroidia bacterium]
MKNKDQIFHDALPKINDFEFGQQVVEVFDDMVSRSVPYYNEMQRMLAELARDFAVEGTNVYDLGCSTGTTLMGFDKMVPEQVKFIGIDDSPEMAKQCEENFRQAGFKRPFEVINADINKGLLLDNPSVVVMCLVLQFIRPLYREKLIHEIYRQLNPQGCFLLVEKVLGEGSMLNRLFIDYYYNYKRRNHYSEMEISQKREALENVLIPYRLSENIELLKAAGFSQTEIFFKWYNFVGIIAVK